MLTEGVFEKFVVFLRNRIFPCFLIVLLLVPVLLSVPVSAASSLYLYNGVELPALPDWDKVTYPYSFLRSSGSTSSPSYELYVSSSPAYISSGELVVGSSGQIYIYRSGSSSFEYSSSFTSTRYISKPSTVFWSSVDIMSGNSVYLAGSEPVPVGGSSASDFTVNQSWDSSQVYAYQEESSADVFSVSVYGGSVSDTYSYQWFYSPSQGGTPTAMPAETLTTFTPKTTAEYLGTSVYFCRVTATSSSGDTLSVDSGFLTVQVTESEPPASEPGGGGGDDPGTSTPDYSEKLDDISNKLEDVSSSITDSTDQIIDTINPATPELDNSLSGIDSDLNDVTSFEDDQIADINDNAHVITDSFEVLGTGSSLAAAFSFVSGILTGTFNELGIIQSVFILPLTIGLFLFLCSRVRGYDRPVRKDISNEYLRDADRSLDGPADFRSSPFYDSDRDQSPL